MNPTASVLNVQDLAGAAQGIATTTLRAVVGDIPLDDVLAKRAQINPVLRTELDAVTERWEAAIKVAEGEKQSAVARRADVKTLGLRYLDALGALGASPATKLVFPPESTSLLRPFAAAAAGDGGTAR